VRIARFTTGDEPQYGVITGDVDDLGIPAEDARIVALAGDPLYVGVQLTDRSQHGDVEDRRPFDLEQHEHSLVPSCLHLAG